MQVTTDLFLGFVVDISMALIGNSSGSIPQSFRDSVFIRKNNPMHNPIFPRACVPEYFNRLQMETGKMGFEGIARKRMAKGSTSGRYHGPPDHGRLGNKPKGCDLMPEVEKRLDKALNRPNFEV